MDFLKLIQTKIEYNNNNNNIIIIILKLSKFDGCVHGVASMSYTSL